ncbi:ras-like small GTPase [Trypanosoma brucei equiperdum]|uniref:Ras-like small GTPase n=1 Tax=Trypanosoma brucei equiperdum TaxID=630700 RepID=A0A3L6KV43_9TRYP|nr:ras-like small GTPase [Trypanosoma brucei equiperdum]
MPSHTTSDGSPTTGGDKSGPRIKIVSLGSVGVGKSCLIKQYCEGRFVSKYIPTIGIDYGVKRVDVRVPAHLAPSGKISIRVNFWDMSGCEEYLEIRNEFYRATEGVLLVYDVTDAESFFALNQWVKEMEAHVNTKGNDTYVARVDASVPCKVVVCANKIDEVSEGGGRKKRAVSSETGRQWAKEHDCKYFETSACTGAGVEEALETLFKDVVAAFF